MRKFLLLLFVFSVVLPAVAAKQYSYFRVGYSNDVFASTTPGTVLMGGGTDVDAAFQWICQRSGNGDFLVIRATGTDAYNPYIQQLCPNENSVATLIIPNRTAASDPFVISTIQSAEALWIAGGDQSNYINYWKGTPVQDALNGLIAGGVPIGGTSAGMNVLSQFIYSAQASQGVTSSQALADPFTRYISPPCKGSSLIRTSSPATVWDAISRSCAASTPMPGQTRRVTLPSTREPHC